MATSVSGAERSVRTTCRACCGGSIGTSAASPGAAPCDEDEAITTPNSPACSVNSNWPGCLVGLIWLVCSVGSNWPPCPVDRSACVNWPGCPVGWAWPACSVNCNWPSCPVGLNLPACFAESGLPAWSACLTWPGCLVGWALAACWACTHFLRPAACFDSTGASCVVGWADRRFVSGVCFEQSGRDGSVVGVDCLTRTGFGARPASIGRAGFLAESACIVLVVGWAWAGRPVWPVWPSMARKDEIAFAIIATSDGRACRDGLIVRAGLHRIGPGPALINGTSSPCCSANSASSAMLGWAGACGRRRHDLGQGRT